MARSYTARNIRPSNISQILSFVLPSNATLNYTLNATNIGYPAPKLIISDYIKFNFSIVLTWSFTDIPTQLIKNAIIYKTENNTIETNFNRNFYTSYFHKLIF